MSQKADSAPTAGPLPNRELDARLAESLGIKWDETRCWICGWPVHKYERDGCTKRSFSQRPVPAKRADEIPYYSTDIRAAFDLVEEMRKRGWTLFMNGQRSTPLVVGSDCWHAAFWRLWEGKDVRVDGAPTAARAIAEAALAALETKDDKGRR